MKVLNFGSLNVDNVYSLHHIVQAGETILSLKNWSSSAEVREKIINTPGQGRSACLSCRPAVARRDMLLDA